MTPSPVEERLLAAAAAGLQPVLAELGTADEVAQQLPSLAASPLAPLAAAALAFTLEAEPVGRWVSTAHQFVARMSEQNGVLALAEAIDALLDAPAAAVLIGPNLHDAMLGGIDDILSSRPHLAAVRLEGALRVALSGARTPYLVLDRLTHVLDGAPAEFAEALPRLLGAALDTWAGEDALTRPLRTALERLADLPELGGDATFELGCDALRLALCSTEGASVLDGLGAAERYFAAAAESEEGRDDATVYQLSCQAVVAFARLDQAALAAAATQLAGAMRRRHVWHLNAHMPSWRIGRLNAEAAWLNFILNLRTASDRLAEATWLDTWTALAELGKVYAAERPRMPQYTDGLGMVINPAIENAVATNAALLDQLKRAVEADRKRAQPILPPAAEVLLSVIRDRERRGAKASTDSDDADPHGARLQRVAPYLLVLEPDVRAQLVASLNDDGLESLNEFVRTAIPKVQQHPVLSEMRANVINQLSRDSRFVGETRAAVITLLERTLTFLLDRYNRGGPFAPGMKDIIKKIGPGDDLPVEADLQQEFFVWLAAAWEFAGRVHAEVSDLSTGRVDVHVRIGEIVLSTEVKRETADASQESLDKYLAQAAEYSGSNVPFSQLLVLDITDHIHGTRSLVDCAWTRSYAPVEGASERHVVAGVVIGNRPTPRFLKTRPQ